MQSTVRPPSCRELQFPSMEGSPATTGGACAAPRTPDAAAGRRCVAGVLRSARGPLLALKAARGLKNCPAARAAALQPAHQNTPAARTSAADFPADAGQCSANCQTNRAPFHSILPRPAAADFPSPGQVVGLQLVRIDTVDMFQPHATVLLAIEPFVLDLPARPPALLGHRPHRLPIQR